MRGYAFAKLYADLVTPDGGVLVTYLSWVRLGLHERMDAGLERYLPDGRREVLRSPAPPRGFAPEHLALGRTLELPLPDGRLWLRHTPRHAGWQPAGPPAAPGLDWSVQTTAAAVEVRLEIGGRREELVGTGYADWVHIDRPTRLLGLRRLRWGRAHLGYASLVWNALEVGDGSTWLRGLHVDGSGPHPGAPALELEQGEGRVTLGGTNLMLTDARLLHRGSAFDEARLPSRLERLVCWAFGGPTSEERWLTRARILGGGPAGFALHEEVLFGPRARRGEGG
ncbi:MAG TPA: hypothetical protein PK668_26845 [Myxococcota bacterium]|nr:hypothetical protein [Myxococcota bacterium]HRY97147.1 hypothetical protein [Myxococcota bacterium]HSA21389.1 hypothetical protein [Myxococcota bacterium]